LLSEAQAAWTAGLVAQLSDADRQREPTWAIKPRDGVGCEGLLRVTVGQLQQAGGFAGCVASATGVELEQVEGSRWIVQPWLPGETLSRSAIVDYSGRLHWLPVTRQRFSESGSIAYAGGSVEPDLAAQIPNLKRLLTRSVKALGAGPCGWVGIDFLYDPHNPRQPITVIEVNPRLTTSFVGLSNAGAPWLAGSIVAAVHAEPLAWPRLWQRVRFSAAGDCEPG
jgi:predicted ATP-grasp superfamily ATP-dependent carboligase